MLHRYLSKTDFVNLLDVCSEAISTNSIEVSYPRVITSLQKIIPFNHAICVKGHGNIIKKTSDMPIYVDEKNDSVKTFEIVNFNYPMEWIDTYMSKEFYKIDPVMLENFRGFKYQRWEDTFKKYPPDREFISHATDFDLRKGSTYGVKASKSNDGSLFSVAGRDIEYSRRTDEVIKYVTPHIHNLLLKDVIKKDDPPVLLTERELEVLKWVCNGKSSWEIGRILNISENTVTFHITNIGIKLGTVNRPQMVAVAMYHGLLGIDDIL